MNLWSIHWKKNFVSLIWVDCNICLSRFRLLSRLETKYEDTMTEYYIAFNSMCKKVAGLPLSEEEGRTIFLHVAINSRWRINIKQD